MYPLVQVSPSAVFVGATTGAEASTGSANVVALRTMVVINLFIAAPRT
jgi:hypothetical protein